MSEFLCGPHRTNNLLSTDDADRPPSLRGNPVYPHIPPSETFADAFTGIFTSYARDEQPTVRWGSKAPRFFARVVDTLRTLLL